MSINKQTVPYFCYGSLKRGFYNHERFDMHLATFIQDDLILGYMISLGSYPMLFTGIDPIRGEVYEVPIEIYHRIKYMELNSGYEEKTLITGRGLSVKVFVGSTKLMHLKDKNKKVNEWTLALQSEGRR